ncbi:MAG: S41 family peptidase [Bacteroidia bacterium]|nr:S41 family peptidase [Bacteroidia bacterium]
MKKNRLTLLILLTCSFISGYAQKQESSLKSPTQKMNKKEIKVLIDSLDTALHSWYVYQDKVDLMLANVKKNFKSGAYDRVENRVELASQLYTDIQHSYKDGHFFIRYNPQVSEFLEAPMPDSVQQQAEYERRLNEGKENNFGFKKIEILQGNIGYIRLDGFYPFIAESTPTFDGAFRVVSNCKELIIDLRHNGGGNPDMVLQTQSYFLKEKTRMNDIINSKNDTLKRWADPAATDFRLSMPVYILTSRYTFSGAEDFAYGLQQVKRATVVGDTTGGGAHPSREFSIGQGFVIRIPTHRSFNLITKTDWEGVGVRPDIAIPSEDALTKAQVLILTERLANAKDEAEKQIFQWNLKSIENRALLTKQLQKETIIIAKDILTKYCGNYTVSDLNDRMMPFAVILKENRIYRHFDDGYEDALVPISPTKFVIDDDSARTIEFVTNKNGEMSELILSKQSGINKMNKK